MSDMFQLRLGCARAMSSAVIVDSASTLGSVVMEDTIVRMHQTNSIAVSTYIYNIYIYIYIYEKEREREREVWCALKERRERERERERDVVCLERENANCMVEAASFVWLSGAACIHTAEWQLLTLNNSFALSVLFFSYITLHVLFIITKFIHVKCHYVLYFLFRWFKFTLKPPYSIAHGKL